MKLAELDSELEKTSTLWFLENPRSVALVRSALSLEMGIASGRLVKSQRNDRYRTGGTSRDSSRESSSAHQIDLSYAAIHFFYCQPWRSRASAPP